MTATEDKIFSRRECLEILVKLIDLKKSMDRLEDRVYKSLAYHAKRDAIKIVSNNETTQRTTTDEPSASSE